MREGGGGRMRLGDERRGEELGWEDEEGTENWTEGEGGRGKVDFTSTLSGNNWLIMEAHLIPSV